MITDYQNPHCEFSICHERAQILRWRPRGGQDVLWCASDAEISLERPIRGGIPVCWPWFANGPDRTLKPSHGFARQSRWQLISSYQDSEETHCMVYGLNDSQVNSAHFDAPFDIRLKYSIGRTLHLSLVVNAGLPSFGAFHSYFNIGDITKTEIVGLGMVSVNNLQNGQLVAEPEKISVQGPTEKRFPFKGGNDRMINTHKVATEQQVRVLDQVNGRDIVLTQHGHSDSMLWSPWDATGRTLADTQDNDYKRFVCVETAAISQPINKEITLEISVDTTH